MLYKALASSSRAPQLAARAARPVRQLSIKASPGAVPSFVPRHLAGAYTTVSLIPRPVQVGCIQLTFRSFHAHSSKPRHRHDQDRAVLTYSGGQGRAGVELGPNRLIDAGLPSQLSQLGWNVDYDPELFFRDVPYMLDGTGKAKQSDPDIGIMKKPRLVSEVCRLVADKVASVADQGALPLTLGGDHSLVSQLSFYWLGQP